MTSLEGLRIPSDGEEYPDAMDGRCGDGVGLLLWLRGDFLYLHDREGAKGRDLNSFGKGGGEKRLDFFTRHQLHGDDFGMERGTAFGPCAFGKSSGRTQPERIGACG